MIWDSAYLKSINATQAETITALYNRISKKDRRIERIEAENARLRQDNERMAEEIRALMDPVKQAEKHFRG